MPTSLLALLIILRSLIRSRIDPKLGIDIGESSVTKYMPCTNATLRGSYGFSFNGSQSGLPVAIVGVAIFDGEGNASSTFTISLNGAGTTGADAVGTYAVNPDCTGSATDMTNNLHYPLVIFRHGAEMFVVNTDPGNTFTGDFQKQ
jgi:hypothetical protein